MLAVVSKDGDGYRVRFERRLKHPVEKVWSYLTDNEKLVKWFSELRIEDLRPGGRILFDMQDGTFEEMEIFELEPLQVLEFAWGEDRVRFELYPDGEGCRLVLIETIGKLTDHTPKDLAGWHVCLDVVETLLDGGTAEEDRKKLWEPLYEQYKRLIDGLQAE